MLKPKPKLTQPTHFGRGSQRALEAAGIEFLPDNGVRLKVKTTARIVAGPAAARKPRSTGKSAPSRARKPARKAKALPMSKEAQIRALREQDAG